MNDIVERLYEIANDSERVPFRYEKDKRVARDAAAEIERLCELVAFNEDQRRMLFDAACKWEAEAMAARKLMKDYWIEGVPWPAYYQSARAANERGEG